MNDQDEIPPDPFGPGHADTVMLRERAGEEFINDLRRIGVYVRSMDIIEVSTAFGPKPALVVHAGLGRVAFSERIQDPEAETIRAEFEEIAKQQKIDEFLDLRSRVQKNIENGERW